MTAQLDTPAPSLGAAYALKCRECGALTDLDASYACMECFGPLEVGYDFGPFSVQAYVTTDVAEENYGGKDTRGWFRVVLPLGNPFATAQAPAPAPLVRKY